MLTITETQEKLSKKEISAKDLVEESLSQIETWEPHLHAFLEVLEPSARQEAARQDANIAAEKAGPLAGIPIAIKDLICTTEGHTTAASKMLANFSSPYDAAVITRLKKAGAIIIGKANLDEFAMGSSNEFSAVSPVANPWNLDRVAGGSSGGPAAAASSGEVPVSLGTDTGGSIRQPASFCGIVGLKPTYGRVSRFGVIAYASSFDQVGPVARTVQDAASILQVIAGHDPRDATSSATRVPDYLSYCGQNIKGLKIGLPRELFNENIPAPIKEAVMVAVKELEKMGARTREISLPLALASIPTYYLLVKAEASSNLARFDGLRYATLDVDTKDLIDHYLKARGKGFGPEVKRSILMGTYTLSAGYFDAWYKQASKVRTKIRQEFHDAFLDVDIIASPTAPETAFPLGAKADDPLAMYLSDSLTDPPSVAGLPAMSVPCGFDAGLPIGLQLITPHFKEELIFQVGHAFEQATPWHTKTPSLPNSNKPSQ